MCLCVRLEASLFGGRVCVGLFFEGVRCSLGGVRAGFFCWFCLACGCRGMGWLCPWARFVVLPVGSFERRVAPVFSLVVWALLLPFLFGVAAVAGLLLP